MADALTMRLRIDPPNKFEGSENFEDFANRVTSYMSLSNEHFRNLLTVCCKFPSEVTEYELLQADTRYQLAAGTSQKLSNTFYYVLSGLVEGAPSILIDQIDDDNGFEAWRKLHARYAKTKLQTSIMMLVEIVNTKFDNDKTFESKLTKWEANITKFEKSINKDLYDEIKVGLLIAGTTGTLHDHLCMHVQDHDYDNVKNIVINYIKTKQFTSSIHGGGKHKNTNSDAMEVDAVHKGIGKGKSSFVSAGKGFGTTKGGKGKGSTKGKGK